MVKCFNEVFFIYIKRAMFIILCTGMMRSASTWSFNVCRLLGLLHAEYLKVPFWSGYQDSENLDILLKNMLQKQQLSLVVKTHSPSQLALSLISQKLVKNICTIRDPRDCVASRQLFENETFEQSVKWIKTNLNYVSFYEDSNNAQFVRYEEMLENPSNQIKIISAYIGVSVNDKQILEINEQTNIHYTKMMSDSLKFRPVENLLRDRSHLVDPVTQIHENHVHGGICGRWKTELTKEQIEIINHEFKPWLIDLGYETEVSIRNYSY